MNKIFICNIVADACLFIWEIHKYASCWVIEDLVMWWPSNSWGPRHVNDGLKVPMLEEHGLRSLYAWSMGNGPCTRWYRHGCASTDAHFALPVKCKRESEGSGSSFEHIASHACVWWLIYGFEKFKCCFACLYIGIPFIIFAESLGSFLVFAIFLGTTCKNGMHGRE